MSFATSAIFGAALALAGSVAAQQAEIEAAVEKWQDALNAGDAEAAVDAAFTDDAKLLPPDAPMVEGRENLVQFWQGVMDAVSGDVELDLLSVDMLGDTAIETGTWAITVPGEDAGEVVELGGKTLVVWKKGEDGTWRMSQDMWNNGR